MDWSTIIILQLQITIENYIFLIDKKIKEREKEDGGLLLSIYWPYFL